jgi:hypothetical protein
MGNGDISNAEEKKEKEKVADFYINSCKSLYDETRNPLYVWRAILFCKDHEREYPDWVKEYLNDVAEGILSIETPGKDAPSLIKRAVGIYSGRDFSEFHDSWKKYEAFDRVVEERRNRSRGEKDSIYHDVGQEFGVSEDTIKRWYQEVKEWRDRIFEND